MIRIEPGLDEIPTLVSNIEEKGSKVTKKNHFDFFSFYPMIQYSCH